MKKTVFGASILFSVSTQAMLVPCNSGGLVTQTPSQSADIDSKWDTTLVFPNDIETRSLAELTIDEVRSLSRQRREELVNYRQIQDPNVFNGEVLIRVLNCIRKDDEIVPIGERVTARYPAQRTFLRYHHNIERGVSFPVERIFATITDIENADISGEIVAEAEHVDTKSPIQHQKRNSGQYKMDDVKCCATPFTEIYISTDSGEEIVDPSKIRDGTPSVEYVPLLELAPLFRESIFIASPTGDIFNYQEIVGNDPNAYIRPDGTIYSPASEKTETELKIYGKVYHSDINFTYEEDETYWKEPKETIYCEKTRDHKFVYKATLPRQYALYAIPRLLFGTLGYYTKWELKWQEQCNNAYGFLIKPDQYIFDRLNTQ